MKKMTSSNYNPCMNCIYSSSCSHIKHNDPVCPERARYDRLAAIEDILGDEYDLDELKEVVQAKREGRCVVLPCKIFDKIWNVAAHYQFEVTEIDLLPYGNILFRCGNKGTDDYAAFYGDDLGDTFTFEEPQERDNCVVKEAALRREQDGNRI